MFRPATVVVLANFLLWTLVSQANHYLALVQTSLFVSGLTVTFAALRLTHADGWRAVFITGLLFDAASPAPFGLQAFLLLTAYTIIYNARSRIPREEPIIGLFVALLANAGIFTVFSIAMTIRHPAPGGALLRLLIELFLSELAVALIAQWFFALQERALEIAGVGLRRDQRGLL